MLVFHLFHRKHVLLQRLNFKFGLVSCKLHLLHLLFESLRKLNVAFLEFLKPFLHRSHIELVVFVQSDFLLLKVSDLSLQLAWNFVGQSSCFPLIDSLDVHDSDLKLPHFVV